MATWLATSGAGVEWVEAAPRTGKTTALGVYVTQRPPMIQGASRR